MAKKDRRDQDARVASPTPEQDERNAEAAGSEFWDPGYDRNERWVSRISEKAAQRETMNRAFRRDASGAND